MEPSPDLAVTPSQILRLDLNLATKHYTHQLCPPLPVTVQIFSCTFVQPAAHVLTRWPDRGLVARN